MMQKYAPPGYTLRDYQLKALDRIVEVWDKSDVIALDAPVGSGKSVLAMTIANWQNSLGKSVAVTTPMVQLQDQYLRDWPSLPTLKGVSHYHCDDMDMSCADVDALLDGKCNGCAYIQCKNNAINSKKALFNVHSYIYLYNNKRNKADPKDVLIVDEAHTTFDILADQFEVILWKKQDKYPSDMETVGQVYDFLQEKSKKLEMERDSLIKGTKEDKKEADKLHKKVEKYRRVMAGIQKSPTNFLLQKTELEYRGKLEDAIKVRVLNLRGMPDILWKPNQKLILMTGTIHQKDIDMLGLKNRRYSHVSVENPIPVQNMPIIIPKGLNMSAKYQEANLPAMAALIKGLKESNKGKGIVHMTYNMANRLATLLKGSAYLYHTQETKDAVLSRFLETKEEVVLIACGMTTGLDLAGPDFSWQAIAKVPYPSLGDPLVAKWLKEDPEWFTWLAIRQVLQATGRICRGPNDYGKTYILDNTVGTLDGKRVGLFSRASRMIPKYFKEAVRYE
jgi:Rad3-related DNA helicase